jgi:hypothetical protein
MAREKYLNETGQLKDPPELVFAREQALSTTGMYASWTTRMVYDYHFGDRMEFDRVLMLRAMSQNPFNQINRASVASRPAGPDTTAQQSTSGRPKRRAAEQASAAWAGLSPQKRQRRAR